MQTVFSRIIKYKELLFNSVDEDIVKFMFSKPSNIILTYCKRKKADKFVLYRKFYTHKMSTIHLT